MKRNPKLKLPALTGGRRILQGSFLNRLGSFNCFQLLNSNGLMSRASNRGKSYLRSQCRRGEHSSARLMTWSRRTDRCHRSLHRLRHRQRLRQDPLAAIAPQSKSRVLLESVTQRKTNASLRRQHRDRLYGPEKNGAGFGRPAPGFWSRGMCDSWRSPILRRTKRKRLTEEKIGFTSLQQALLTCAVLFGMIAGRVLPMSGRNSSDRALDSVANIQLFEKWLVQ